MTTTTFTTRSITLAAPRARRAFTLIELIAVIAIIGLIGVAVGGPTLAYLASIRTRGAAARIATDIRYAQRWAMSSRNRTWVAFDVAGNAYSLYAENPDSPGKAGRQPLAGALDRSTGASGIGDSPFNGAALASVSIGGTAEVEFDSFGKPYNSSSIVLGSTGAIQLNGGVTISILPVTGLAEVSG